MSPGAGRRGLALLVGAVAGFLAACPSGLPLEEGNAYRCRFEGVDPLERDLQCPPNWVCGADERCRAFTLEEIWHCEALPSDFTASNCNFPVLDPADAGRLYPLHPVAPVRALAWASDDLRPGGARLGAVFEGTREIYELDFGQLQTRARSLPQAVGAPGAVVELHRAGGERRLLYLDRAEGTLFVDGLGPVGMRPDGGAATPVVGAVAVRRFLPLLDEQQAMALVRDGPAPADGGASRLWAGELVFRPGPMAFELVPFELSAADGGSLNVRDVRVFASILPVVLADEGVFLRCRSRLTPPDAGCAVGSGDEGWVQVAEVPPSVRARALYPSADGTVWALVVDRAGPSGIRQVAALRRAQLLDGGVGFEDLFGDCAPCGQDALIYATPFSDDGAGMDVLCEHPVPEGRTLRYVRRATPDGDGRCEVRGMTLAYDPGEVVSVDDTRGGYALLGGRNGQLFAGATLAEARPLFLDRAPLASTRFADRLLALTPDYLAVEQPGLGMVVATPPGEAPPVAVIKNANGAFVFPGGYLLRVTRLLEGADGGCPDDGGCAPQDQLAFDFGPPLLNPTGGEAPGPFLGEALYETDAGLVTFVASALDSLYFGQDVRFDDPTPDPQRGLTPQVALEPNFPIRSLAVNRSGEYRTGQSDLLTQGYAVTSGRLFEFNLSRDTQRWSLTELPVAPGEPVGVRMLDAQREEGRVIYRDGRVFTLPGGYALTPQIGESVRVLAFENPRGMPVALTDQGVFRARMPDLGYDPEEGIRYRMWDWAPVEVPGHGDAGFEFGHLSALFDTPGSLDPDGLYFFDARGAVYHLGRVRRP